MLHGDNIGNALDILLHKLCTIIEKKTYQSSPTGEVQ